VPEDVKEPFYRDVEVKKQNQKETAKEREKK
jgi:hypothetical protein